MAYLVKYHRLYDVYSYTDIYVYVYKYQAVWFFVYIYYCLHEDGADISCRLHK